jgi:hypothetical protein
MNASCDGSVIIINMFSTELLLLMVSLAVCISSNFSLSSITRLFQVNGGVCETFHQSVQLTTHVRHRMSIDASRKPMRALRARARAHVRACVYWNSKKLPFGTVNSFHSVASIEQANIPRDA